MTAVGKILVFFNLIFSVATAAMIVIVFTTRTNWKKEYETARNVALIAEAKYKERTAENESLKSSKSDESKSKDTTIESQAASIAKLQTDLANVEKLYAAEMTKYGKENTTQKASVTEVGFLKTEREGLNADNLKLKEQNIKEIEATAAQRKLAIENKIEADSQRARAEQLLRRNEEVERENLTLKSQNKILVAEGGGGKPSSLLNPPPLPAPKDVEGTILAVSPSGIVVISLGSDSGINVNNKLEVSRRDLVNPERSIYLGEVTITRVEPKRSVGQFTPQPFARPNERLPKEKDTVSTGISGPGR